MFSLKSLFSSRLPIAACLLPVLFISGALAAGESGEKAPDGKALYARHCAECHRSLDNTDKPGRSVTRIQSAIKYLPAMNHLSQLTEEECRAIALELRMLRR